MASSRQRVPRHTARQVQERIDARTRESIHRASGTGQAPARIDRRLRELDREWDIERAIEANASALALAGIVLGGTADRRWLALSGLVTGFLFQHAVQGWCPPVPILRRLGFRTSYEIDEERQALKALRGDFAGLSGEEGGKRSGRRGRGQRRRAEAAFAAVRG